MDKPLPQSAHRKRPGWLRVLGPGLVTGAADDDPSGIATYSQAGAAFGYGQLWTLTLCLPLMMAVQEASARIGLVTGQGLAQVTALRYSRKVLFAVVMLVVVANTINIAADIAAVGASLQLLIPLPISLLCVLFTVVVVLLEVFVGYHQYARFLKLLALALLSYVATALLVYEPWLEILRATFIPQIQFTTAYLYVIVGILGTTISPYMFFWQAAEEVEEREYADRMHEARRTIAELRTDNALGMGISQAGSWFMMVTTATVLHAHGVTNIATTADAARALEPLVQTFPHAGTWAKLIFAFGVVGMGLLGIPVLAGSASYAVSEALGWREGLEKKPAEAKGFYAVIVASIAIGLAITLLGIDPMRSLIFAAVLNGIVAVPLVFLIGHIARNRDIMGHLASGRLSRFMLAATFVVMAACAVALFASFF